MRNIKDYLKTPRLICFGIMRHTARMWPDELYLRLLFYFKMGMPLNLKAPKTFNEKLQWLKLHDCRPEYTRMVDKYEAKKYVAGIIGEQYIIPTLGVWDSVEDINFDLLPQQFVLKCTHDSGGVVVCSDKTKLDVSKAKRKLKKGLRKNFFWQSREYPYRNVKPRIIAEKYLSVDKECGLEDYKVHSFNGVPRFILVCRDRFSPSGLKEDFYSDKWEHLEVKRKDKDNPGGVEQPQNLQEMLELTRKLSKDMPFARCDFYNIKGKLYFGEITLYPASGTDDFVPESYDLQFGNWINLPLI